jgi:phosphonate transport system permease protein
VDVAVQPAAHRPDPAAVLAAADRERRRRRRPQRALAWLAFGAALAVAIPVGGLSLERFVSGLPQITAYVAATLPPLGWRTLGADLADWYWAFPRYVTLTGETLLIAYAGTLLGLVGALAFGFPASANLVQSRALRFLCRRILEFARTVPELVFALVFVFAFGVGPLPGVLAVAVHSMGALGKLFAEVNENTDLRPLEGVAATGASWCACMRFAVLPQVLPNYASYTLFRFEINVRSASVLGFVGAGGIGHELYTSIRSFAYVDVSAVVLVIVGMVVLTDLASEHVRTRFLGREGLR